MSNGVATVGSCMAFSLGLAASGLQAEYEGLAWSNSGEVTQLGDVGPENAVLTFDTICDGKVNKRMGPTNFGQQALELAYVNGGANAAQVLLQGAVLSKVKVSARESLNGGDILYYEGYISSAKVMAGTSQDIIKLSVNFELDSAIVTVLAA